MDNLFFDIPDQSKIETHEEENMNTGTTIVIVDCEYSNRYYFSIASKDKNWLAFNPGYSDNGTSLKIHETGQEIEDSYAHSEGEKEIDEDFDIDIDFKPNFKSFKKRVKIKSVTKQKHKGVL